mmetsp:Transcript_1833/g.2504  ORF Transcript_1833/g.2504 Transcript_1833/m.2504 type:complete len:496 (-) Transcript_1833:400-1887(-)
MELRQRSQFVIHHYEGKSRVGCTNIGAYTVKLIPRQCFLEMGMMTVYELCYMLQVRLSEVQKDSCVLFVSHRWQDATNNLADNSRNVQYDIIKKFLELHDEVSYVWIDISCITQDIRNSFTNCKIQLDNIQTAIMLSDYVLVVPRIEENDEGTFTDLKEINSRGWCLFETLAAMYSACSIYITFVADDLESPHFLHLEGGLSPGDEVSLTVLQNAVGANTNSSSSNGSSSGSDSSSGSGNSSSSSSIDSSSSSGEEDEAAKEAERRRRRRRRRKEKAQRRRRNREAKHRRRRREREGSLEEGHRDISRSYEPLVAGAIELLCGDATAASCAAAASKNWQEAVDPWALIQTVKECMAEPCEESYYNWDEGRGVPEEVLQKRAASLTLSITGVDEVGDPSYQQGKRVAELLPDFTVERDRLVVVNLLMNVAAFVHTGYEEIKLRTELETEQLCESALCGEVLELGHKWLFPADIEMVLKTIPAQSLRVSDPVFCCNE